MRDRPPLVAGTSAGRTVLGGPGGARKGALRTTVPAAGAMTGTTTGAGRHLGAGIILSQSNAATGDSCPGLTTEAARGRICSRESVCLVPTSACSPGDWSRVRVLEGGGQDGLGLQYATASAEVNGDAHQLLRQLSRCHLPVTRHARREAMRHLAGTSRGGSGRSQVYGPRPESPAISRRGARIGDRSCRRVRDGTRCTSVGRDRAFQLGGRPANETG